MEDLQGRLRSVEQERLEGEDWDQFLACNDRPNASNEAELNTFLQVWKEDSERSFESVLKEVVKVDGIAADVEVLLARALASGDMDTIAHYEKFKVLLRDAQIHKLDAATAHLLNNVGDYTNEKNECKIGRAGGGIKYGLWANVALKAFRLKVVEFPKTGITLDIQKRWRCMPWPCAQCFIPVRMSWGTSAKGDDILSEEASISICWPCQSAPRMSGWKMAYISDLTDGFAA